MKAFALLLATLLLAGPAFAQDAGIHVVGTWTLAVYNADGSLDESVQFTNDLTRNGANLMLNLFGKLNRFAGLGIRVRATGGNDLPCTDDTGTPSDCYLIEAGDPYFGASETSELTFEKITEPDPGLIRYTGTISADRATEISQVWAISASCFYNISDPCTIETRSNPSQGIGSYGDFTLRALDTPLPVAAGQSVDVTFELSFE